MFARSLDLVDECGLTHLHVFPFSPRPGTPAARMPQVAREVVKERARRLRDKGEAALARHLSAEVGTRRMVLTESQGVGRTEGSRWCVSGAGAGRRIREAASPDMTAATCWLPSDEPDATKARLLGPPHRARGREPPKPAADPAASRSEGTPDFTTATGADPARRRRGDASLAGDAGRREASARAFGADLQPVEGVEPQGAARGAGAARRTRRVGGCRPEELVAASQRRHAAHLVLDRRERHRPAHQAQARQRDARGARGRADPGRSRRRDRDAHRRGDRQGPLRQGDLDRGGEARSSPARSRRSWRRSRSRSRSTGRRSRS